MTKIPDISRAAMFIRPAGWGTHDVHHGFSTRRGGVPHGGEMEDFLPGFLAAAGFPGGRKPILLHQVHGDQVHAVPLGVLSPRVPAADSAVTTRSDVILLVRTADCVPVLLTDPAAGVIGVLHAGWRGALAGIVARTLEVMANMGASPLSTRAAIGPAIGPCCLAVGTEVAKPFAGISPALVRGRGAAWHLDLPGAVGHLLRLTGMPEEAIETIPACTRCRTDLFYSHRGEQGRAGRLMAAISIA